MDDKNKKRAKSPTITITESEMINHSCIVKSSHKWEGRWIEYKSLTWRNICWASLN